MKTKSKLFALYLSLFLFTTACRTVYKADPAQAAARRQQVIPHERIMSKQQDGTDFVASGNDPVPWTLEVDMEKGFFFKPGDGRLFIGPPATATIKVGEHFYETRTDSGMMKISVTKGNCSSASLVKKDLRAVSVLFANKNYTGCGGFLYDFLLNDIWLLQSINNNPIKGGKQDQVPLLEFNLVENSVSGFDGCRKISSSIAVEGNRIRFMAFTTAPGKCASILSSTIFSSMLSGKTVDYSIKDGQLTLYLADDSKMVFRKS